MGGDASGARARIVAVAVGWTLAWPALAMPALAVEGPGLPPLGLDQTDLILRPDPDGGKTMRLLLDDPWEGQYFYQVLFGGAGALPLNLQRTIANLPTVGPVLNQTLNSLRDGELRQLGLYEHLWYRGFSPMTALGAFTVTQGQGLVRWPFVILENITRQADLVALANRLAGPEKDELASLLLPYVYELADPSRQEFRNYAQNNTNTYEDRPMVVAWLVRKVMGVHDLWEGLYVHREASRSSDGASVRAYKVVDVGVAVRVDRTQVVKAAGAYVRHDVATDVSEEQRVSSTRVTLGLSSPKGRTPLAGLEGYDQRSDLAGELYNAPDAQTTGLRVGAYLQGGFVPLLGTQTEASHHPYVCPPPPQGQPNPGSSCVRSTRLTSVGVYAQGRYVPLAGVRTVGERAHLASWANLFTSGGGPGAQNAGSMRVDVGAFVDGAFTPLAGAAVQDRVPGGLYPFQTMVHAGVHGPQGYQPLVGATYDGQLPLLTWASAYQSPQASKPAWLLSAGTFVGPRYLPLVGLRYLPAVPGGAYGEQQQFTLGTFLLDYRRFVPLAGIAWDGERPPLQWAPAFANGGTLGSKPGDFNLAVATYLDGAYRPLVGLQFREEYRAGFPAQTMLVAGAYGPFGFVPLVGLTYAGTDHLVGSLNNPTNLRDDDPWYVTAGVFVEDQYVPVLLAGADGSKVTVGLLPPEA